jgi:hypothetical protein
VEAARILLQRSKVVLYGDQALLDLGARRATRFDQLVGPYSREGFHHPGPAVFYLLAPFVRILGHNGPGLYLGAIAISGGALFATVAFLWRHLGAITALWAATAIDLYCLCLRVGTLREPWNPYLVATPMVLFVVLWAAGMTGSAGAGLWAVVMGSYEVQTHIATAGFVVTMSMILVVWTTVSAGRRHRVALARHMWGPARITGTGALALIWVAPIVELWRDQPNNLSLIWDFFTTSHSGNVHQALRVAANALTIMPFGYRDYTLSLSRTTAQIGIGVALMVSGLVIAVTLGWRRCQPFSLALSAGGVLGAVLGLVSLCLTGGPVYLYFAVWLAYVPLSLLLAILVALGPFPVSGISGRLAPPTRGTLRRPLVALSVVAAVVATAATLQSDLRMAPISTSSGGGPWPGAADRSSETRSQAPIETAALARAAERSLRPGDRWVGFTIGTTGLWPYVAGMVLELDERGVQSTVGPSRWELYFGHERTPGRPVSVEFDLYSATDTAGRAAAVGTRVAEIDGDVLTCRRMPG